MKDSSRAKPCLITTTTFWAAYVCGVNVKAMSEVLWLGIGAVAWMGNDHLGSCGGK